MEIKFDISDFDITFEELQEKFSKITADLIKKNVVENFSISKKFKPIFIVYVGECRSKLIANFFNKFNTVYSTDNPKPDFYDLSKAYSTGEIEKKKVVQEFLSNKAYILALVNSFKVEHYVETNETIFSILPIISEIIPNSKFIFIVRDGRDTVTDAINDNIYTLKDPLNRITALDYPDDSYFNTWHIMSQFEQACWWWKKTNNIIFDDVKERKDTLMVKYEDIMHKKHYGTHIRKICQFIGYPSNNKVLKVWDKMLAEYDKQKPTGDFPHWKDWTNEQKEQFEKFAGEHMREIGYSLK
jgi:hypothetical protein